MKTYRIRPLPLTLLDLDLSILTYRCNYGKKVQVPVYAWYIEGGDRPILVDTGVGAKVATDLRGFPAEPIATFEEALAKVDLTPDDIGMVIHTHLHWDHCGNTRKCRNARLIVSETEYHFALSPHPILAMIYKKPLFMDLSFTLVDGYREILPGIELIPAPGHTPGTIAVAVRTEQGKAVISGFCCTRDNFEVPESIREYLPVIPPGTHLNAADGFESALRIKGMADILIPIHDPSYVGVKCIP